MISQDENGFKHVSFLRKAILEKRTGTAWFGGDGWDNQISFEHGVMPAGVAAHLACILREPVFRMGWDQSAPRGRKSANHVQVRHIFSQVIEDMDMPVKRMIAYRRKFEALPNVRTRYMATFRSDADYQKHFQMLYRMSLGAQGIHLEDYFAAATDIAELRKRVNIVIGAYCLGDLLPAVSKSQTPKASDGQATQNIEKAGIVSRIMARLRENMN